MKFLITFFILSFAFSVNSKELPTSLFGISLLDLKKMYIDKSIPSYVGKLFSSYNINDIIALKKNKNFDNYYISVDNKYIYGIKGYKTLDLPDYSNIDENSERKTLQLNYVNLLMQIYDFENPVNNLFLEREVSKEGVYPPTKDKIYLIDEIAFEYNTQIVSFGDKNLRYMISCIYGKNLSFFTIQLSLKSYDDYSVYEEEEFKKIDKLNFNFLTHDISGL